jgi:hypothetical protein
MIDHPGFLRGFSAKLRLPTRGGTTITVTLPVPGALHATADIKYLDPGPDFLEGSKIFCIRSSLGPTDPYSFEMSKLQPLHNWELWYGDLAPGKYKLFSTGRHCVKEGEFGGGPAGVAGQSVLTVKPETVTEMSYPLFPRGKFSDAEKISAKITYRSFSSADDTTRD